MSDDGVRDVQALPFELVLISGTERPEGQVQYRRLIGQLLAVLLVEEHEPPALASWPCP